MVNYCSGDCPMYIVSILQPYVECSRGYPEEFIPAFLNVSLKAENNLIEFCKRYLPREDKQYKPKWYLSSYWG